MFGNKSKICKMFVFPLSSILMFLSNSCDQVNSAKVSDLIAELEKLESEKNIIKKESDKLNKKIAEQKDKQNNLHGDISKLEVEVNSVGNLILQLRKEVHDNESRIKELKNQIENKKHLLKKKRQLYGKCLSLMYKGKVFDIEGMLKAKEYRDLEYRLGVSKKIWDRFCKLSDEIDKEIEEISASVEQVNHVTVESQEKIKQIEEKQKIREDKIEILQSAYAKSKDIEKKAIEEIDDNSDEMKRIEKQVINTKKEIDKIRRTEEERKKKLELERKRKKNSKKKNRRSKIQDVNNDDSLFVESDFGDNSKGLLWPVPGYTKITGQFGEKRPGHKHGGVDIGRKADGTAIYKSPIFASGDMYIVYASYGNNGGFGNHVRAEINVGGKTYQLWYGHLDSICVFAGQFVKKGQKIGYVGNTGRSYGAHLHFEVHELVNGNYVKINPLLLIKPR